MNLKAIPALCVTLCVGQTLQAQLEYSVNADDTLTITGYTGPPWDVTIPTNINGLTVVAIGDSAFETSKVTSVIIPGSVTSIGEEAFWGSSLMAVTLPDSVTSIGTAAFSICQVESITIPGSATNIGESAFASCGALTNVLTAKGVTSIPMDAFANCTALASVMIFGSVSNIGYGAFYQCASLAGVTIPASVTSISDYAFEGCTSLTRLYFLGNAPSADSTVFDGDSSNPTIYYLPGTSGWSSPFASRQALLWNPAIQTGGTNFGVQSNQFGFNITGTPYIPIVVEACTNLANPLWTPLKTLTLTNGSFYFGEPVQTNVTSRFYRITFP